MALYRNIAGAEKLGLLLEQFDSGGSGDTFILPEDGGTIKDESGNVFLDPLPTSTVFSPVPITSTVPPPVPITYDPGFPINEPVTQIPIEDLIKITDKPQTPLPLPGGGSGLPVVNQEIDYMPFLTMGALLFTAVYGEKYIKRGRRLAYVGGLGLLYYQFVRKE